MSGTTQQAGRRQTITVAMAADEQGVTEETVRRWIRSGDLPAIRLGNRAGFRIAVKDWEAFLATRRVVAAVDLD